MPQFRWRFAPDASNLERGIGKTWPRFCRVKIPRFKSRGKSAMHWNKKSIVANFIFFLFFSGIQAFATGDAANTKVNARDRSPTELTADQQKMNKRDTETTRQIRRALVKDESLSMNAHNIKVITVDGFVTIKGPVDSQSEEISVLRHAQAIAGNSNVINEIAIQTKY